MDPLREIAAAYERDLVNAHEQAIMAGPLYGEPLTAWRVRVQSIKLKIDWLAYKVAESMPGPVFGVTIDGTVSQLPPPQAPPHEHP